MALVDCPECGQRVSSAAASCPACGHPLTKPIPIAQRQYGCLSTIGVFLVLIVAVPVVIAIINSSDSPSQRAVTRATPVPAATANSSAAASPSVPPVRPDSWIYTADPSDMQTGGTDRWAMVRSSNIVQFDFPYNDPQQAMLVVRHRAGKPIDILFELQRGQLLCSAYSGCNVEVKFDDKPPRRFPAGEPSDHDSKVLFVERAKDFVAELKQAKSVKIEVTVFQNGSPVFDFPVDGFSIDKLEAAKP